MVEETAVNLDFLNDKEAGKLYVESEKIQPGNLAGVFIAEIVKANIQTSQASGNPMVVWQLTVAQGPYAGRFLPVHRNMLPTPDDDEPTKKQKWGRLKGELALCQVSLGKLSDLPKALEKLAGRFIQVRSTPQKDKETGIPTEYSNVTIQKYVETLEEVEWDGKPAF